MDMMVLLCLVLFSVSFVFSLYTYHEAKRAIDLMDIMADRVMKLMLSVYTIEDDLREKER